MDDATRASRSGRSGPDAVAGLLALLLIDLWRITAAIEAAGGGGSAPEVFDAAAA